MYIEGYESDQSKFKDSPQVCEISFVHEVHNDKKAVNAKYIWLLESG